MKIAVTEVQVARTRRKRDVETVLQERADRSVPARPTEDRPPEPERFYVPTDTSGILEGSRIATSWLARHGHEWDGEPLVVVPADKYATSNEYIRKATLEHRWETSLAYQGARARGWEGGVVVLFYPDSRVLGWFDRNQIVPALCVVQGSIYDTNAWAKAYGPEDLTTGFRYPHSPDVDPVVVQGLTFVQRSRHWRQLTNAADISLMVRTLRLLQAHGHRFASQELEAWALSEHWKASAADRLAAYADKVSDGRYIPLRAMTSPPHGAIARWRKRAGVVQVG
jgi:hypothetical protein